MMLPRLFAQPVWHAKQAEGHKTAWLRHPSMLRTLRGLARGRHLIDSICEGIRRGCLKLCGMARRGGPDNVGIPVPHLCWQHR